MSRHQENGAYPDPDDWTIEPTHLAATILRGAAVAAGIAILGGAYWWLG